MEKNFNGKELEILIDLVDEEIEETKKLQNDVEMTTEEQVINDEKLKTLNLIKDNLEIKPYSKEIELGIEIGKITSGYDFEEIYKFVTHKSNRCYSYTTLRDLYDKFDYNKVNEIITYIGDIKYQKQEEDQDESN